MSHRGRRNSFGTIIATGTATKPAFVIRWWEGSRRKKKSGFRTRTDAAEALARIRTGLGDGTLVEKRRAAIGFDEVARQWLDLHSRPNLRSHADNEERYRVHVAPFFGDAPLTAVKATRILEFRAKLQGTGLAPRTVNLVLALVRTVLRFAVANGHIPASPTDRLGRGKLMLPIETAKLAPPIEHPEDVGRLLAVLRELGDELHRPELHPFFALLAYTGLRRGEALGLRWSDVDLERRMITVRRSYEGQTKSSKHRTVPVPAGLVSILRAYRLADPWKGELVFPNAAGEMYSPNAKLETLLRRALGCAKLPAIRVHDLRHVFASHFVMGGGDIFTLQRILGHSTPQLTSDTYAHLSPRHLAGEADRVAYPEPTDPAEVLPFTAKASR
jgi:integrase